MKLHLRILFAAAWVGIGCKVGASAPPAAGISPKQIPNFHAVTPNILRGAAPTTEGLRSLQAMGVKTIVDLRIAPKAVGIERRQVAALGMRYINLPMSGEPPTEAEIKTFRKTLADAGAQPVFVHCQHGADRTGTMIGIYRETTDGWSFDRTYREMRKYGFNPHWKKLADTVRRFAPKRAGVE